TTLAILALALAATGVVLLLGSAADRAYVSLVAHRAGALVLPLLYLLHRRLGGVRPGTRAVLLASAGILIPAGALVAFDPISSSPAPTTKDASDRDPFVPWKRSPGAPSPEDPFFPSPVLTRSGKLASDDSILGPFATTPALLDGKPVATGAQACVRCHPDVT